MSEKLFNILNSITGFNGKVAYRAFPVGEAPSLPFICYLLTSSDNFLADNTVYYQIQEYDIELYSHNKDEISESLIEQALNENGLIWSKSEDFIDSENCYQITYTTEV